MKKETQFPSFTLSEKTETVSGWPKNAPAVSPVKFATFPWVDQGYIDDLPVKSIKENKVDNSSTPSCSCCCSG